jgi:hypothetical protein
VIPISEITQVNDGDSAGAGFHIGYGLMTAFDAV